MRSKLFFKDLKKLMLEEDEPEEDRDPEPVETEGYAEVTRLANDSVDDQIDGYFLKFESDSISESDMLSENLQRSLVEMSLSGLLAEQDEDEQPEEDEGGDTGGSPEGDAAESDAGVDVDVDPSPPVGSEDPDLDATPPEKVVKLPIDLDLFTKKVVRLSMNAHYLLDIREVIVNRALNFLLDNYDQQHVDDVKEILNSQFSFNLDQETEEPEAPNAVGAWAGGTGGLGGGGG